MFGGSKSDINRSGGRPGGLSIIGADVTIKGDLSTEADIHIDGAVEGDIACGSLVQGASSRIAGTIRARAARLAGTVEGEVQVTQLTIEASARIKGDSTYESLAIAVGAQVDGRMTHAAARQPDAPLRLVDASEA